MKPRVLIVLALIAVVAIVVFLAFIRRSSEVAGPPPAALPRVALIGPPRIQPQIVGGWGNMIVLAPDGSLWGWGDLGEGVLGTGFTNLITTPRRIGRDSDWKAVASGWHFIIGLKTNGTLWLWGSFKANWTRPSAAEAAPVPFSSDTNWISVSGRSAHVVALKADGTVWTWGANNYGQLGDGTTKSRQTPLQIPGTNWTAISAGSFHSVGLQNDGTMWVWGDDPLAIGHFPTQVGSESNWMSLFAGEFHTIAVKNDGTTWVWGKCAASFMSVPFVNRLIPVQGAQPWSAVAAGNAHNLGLNNDGSLWAWGNNSAGELGDGTNIRTATPVQIGLRTEWAAIGASGNMSAGLTKDGSLWSWGIRLDQPPTIRVNRKVTTIGQLLIPFGVKPSSREEKIYVRSAQPELIFKFNRDSTNAASKLTQ